MMTFEKENERVEMLFHRVIINFDTRFEVRKK